MKLYWLILVLFAAARAEYDEETHADVVDISSSEIRDILLSQDQAEVREAVLKLLPESEHTEVILAEPQSDAALRASELLLEEDRADLESAVRETLSLKASDLLTSSQEELREEIRSQEEDIEKSRESAERFTTESVKQSADTTETSNTVTEEDRIEEVEQKEEPTTPIESHESREAYGSAYDNTDLYREELQRHASSVEEVFTQYEEDLNRRREEAQLRKVLAYQNSRPQNVWQQAARGEGQRLDTASAEFAAASREVFVPESFPKRVLLGKHTVYKNEDAAPVTSHEIQQPVRTPQNYQLAEQQQTAAASHAAVQQQLLQQQSAERIVPAGFPKRFHASQERELENRLALSQLNDERSGAGLLASQESQITKHQAAALHHQLSSVEAIRNQPVFVPVGFPKRYQTGTMSAELLPQNDEIVDEEPVIAAETTTILPADATTAAATPLATKLETTTLLPTTLATTTTQATTTHAATTVAPTTAALPAIVELEQQTRIAHPTQLHSVEAEQTNIETRIFHRGQQHSVEATSREQPQLDTRILHPSSVEVQHLMVQQFHQPSQIPHRFMPVAGSQEQQSAEQSAVLHFEEIPVAQAPVATFDRPETHHVLLPSSLEETSVEVAEPTAVVAKVPSLPTFKEEVSIETPELPKLPPPPPVHAKEKTLHPIVEVAAAGPQVQIIPPQLGLSGTQVFPDPSQLTTAQIQLVPQQQLLTPPDLTQPQLGHVELGQVQLAGPLQIGDAPQPQLVQPQLAQPQLIPQQPTNVFLQSHPGAPQIHSGPNNIFISAEIPDIGLTTQPGAVNVAPQSSVEVQPELNTQPAGIALPKVEPIQVQPIEPVAFQTGPAPIPGPGFPGQGFPATGPRPGFPGPGFFPHTPVQLFPIINPLLNTNRASVLNMARHGSAEVDVPQRPPPPPPQSSAEYSQEQPSSPWFLRKSEDQEHPVLEPIRIPDRFVSAEQLRPFGAQPQLQWSQPLHSVASAAVPLPQMAAILRELSVPSSDVRILNSEAGSPLIETKGPSTPTVQVEPQPRQPLQFQFNQGFAPNGFHPQPGPFIQAQPFLNHAFIPQQGYPFQQLRGAPQATGPAQAPVAQLNPLSLNSNDVSLGSFIPADLQSIQGLYERNQNAARVYEETVKKLYGSTDILKNFRGFYVPGVNQVNAASPLLPPAQLPVVRREKKKQ